MCVCQKLEEEKKKDEIELSADIVGSETRKVKGEKSFTVCFSFCFRLSSIATHSGCSLTKTGIFDKHQERKYRRNV